MRRRHFIAQSAALAGTGLLAACAGPGQRAPKAKVVVVGGGYGGATAAKYLRLFSEQSIEVTLIEPQANFISCPMSNLVVGGVRGMADITMSYDALSQRHGVQIVKDYVTAVDLRQRTVTLAGGARLPYDKLVLSPGVDMMWDGVEGLRAAHERGQVLHAWKAGAETLALRRQLEAMPDNGVYAISIPEAPYRCPPGPYERASLFANYFKQAKPRAKVLILDANPDVTSKGPLFKKYWAEQLKGRLEYIPQHKATAVSADGRTLSFDVQNDVRADVLNVLPPMRAGEIAVKTGLANANARWCLVDYLTFASTVDKDVHVIGDAIQVAPLMPKSGHMANAQAKVVAAAVTAQLSGAEVNAEPLLINTCYSYVEASKVIHVSSVHQYVAAEKTFKTVPGSGGVSTEPNAAEATLAHGWARNIWADTLQ